MNENKRSHLEMIQGIVNRLSQNSFLLKGWSVVLVSALMALAAKDSNLVFILLAYLPAFAFWFLDGYFLWQERLFRKLYDYVRQLKDDEINYSMDLSVVKNNNDDLFKAILSKTLILFHGVIIIALIAVMILITSK